MTRPPSLPAELAAAGPFPPAEGTLDRALALVSYLRAYCPWDARQTAESLIPYLLEETGETVDAIRRGDPAEIRDELGDLLLNLAFQVVVAEEAGAFTREAVVEGLERKMVRRHPHLFGLGERESWEVLKAREREEARHPGSILPEPGGVTPPAPATAPAPATPPATTTTPGDRTPPSSAGAASVLDGVPSGLDPLQGAERIQRAAAGTGFDWEDVRGAIAKLREELGEVEEALDGREREALDGELGDLLFSAVNVVRLAGARASAVLAGANQKFRRRFRTLEALADERGLALSEASLKRLDALWEEVKAREGPGPGPGPGPGAIQQPLSTPQSGPPRSREAHSDPPETDADSR